MNTFGCRHVFAVFALGGCSLINAPDDIQPGGGAGGSSSGGSGNSGGETGGGGSETGGGGSETGGGGTGNVGGMPECAGDPECAGLNTPCAVGVCSAGACMAQPRPMGAPCGAPVATDCSAPDACDGSGMCVPNDAPDGAPCNDCPSGAGLCTSCLGGMCGDCAGFAAVNRFQGAGALAGWDLTGGWALHHEAVYSYAFSQVPFGKQVLGTDGNRSEPYPGAEMEIDTHARTPPTVLPQNLMFRSWHVDEGQSGDVLDAKRVRISTNGGQTWTTVADCVSGPNQNAPFCTLNAGPRDRMAWDDVAINTGALAGQVGIVEFSYNTQDGCCDFEQGWYIDQLNFATQCACNAPLDCAHLSGDCSLGACDATTGECLAQPTNIGGVCGDVQADTCNEPDSCNAFGTCSDNRVETGGWCDSCGGGGSCECFDTMCLDCVNPLLVNNFDYVQYASGWITTGDWRPYLAAPPSQNDPLPIVFATRVFGTDGNRQLPYPGMETETSTATSQMAVLPANLNFDSWHIDEGGAGGLDNKIVRVSTDGVNWIALVDCNTNPGVQPFCSPVSTRLATDWDAISLPVPVAMAGQMGYVELAYDTIDEATGFERGWFIDNLNFLPPCLITP